MNKNCFKIVSVTCRSAIPNRRSGMSTTNYLLIRLSGQVSIPLCRFIHFLEHETRCGSNSKKNCLNSCHFQRTFDFRGVQLIFRIQFGPHNMPAPMPKVRPFHTVPSLHDRQNRVSRYKISQFIVSNPGKEESPFGISCSIARFDGAAANSFALLRTCA